MWIARDKDGSLWFYEKEPLAKDSQCWISSTIGKNERLELDEDWFPEVKWDDNPIELTNKERAIDALYNILGNFVHGGDADCIIAEFERELDKVE